MLRTTNRYALIVILLLTSARSVFAAPGNDLCANATQITPVLTCGAVASQTLYQATATGSVTSTCGTTNDVWYYFQVPSNSTAISIDVTPTGGGSNLTSANTYIEVFNANTCGAIAINNTYGCSSIGSTYQLTGLTPSQTYYFRVFTTATPTTTPSSKWAFSVCVVYSPPPANDDCTGAITLTSGTAYTTGTVWMATNSGTASCGTGTPDDDVWFKITSTGTNMTINLTSIGSNLSTSGAVIEVFSGSCATLVSKGCNATSMSLAVTNTTPYYIRVYSAGSGSIGGSSSGSDFTITATTSIPPGNDDCDYAYTLPTSTTTLNSRGSVDGATASQSIPIGSCTGTPDDDVWYKFVATKTAPVIALANLGANLSASGARLQLFGGNCGALNSLACGTTSITASSLTIGNTYFVRVYSAGSTMLTSAANFDISVTDPGAAIVTDSTTALFNIDTVAKQLGYPWEVTLGPDDSLWITEARGYRVLRVSSTRTEVDKNDLPQQVLKIPLNSTQVTFGRSIGTWPQGGMQGLAIHPEFSTGFAKQLVYLAYVYTGTCASNSAVPCIFRTKIVQCQFYYASDPGNPSFPLKDTLVIIDTVMSNLPGSNDHNSGRLKFGPVKENGTYKLYYTIGDMGAGQFNNASRTNYAQTPDTCEGKILRLNSERDLDPSYGVTHEFNTWRDWIPNDNPFKHSIFTNLPTPIYSYGHRNAQGLAWGNVNGTWRLYSSEHGDRSDDEVNIIQSGKNYGWPKVTGMADDNYNTADDATDGFTMNNILANATVNDEKTFANNTPNYQNPLFDFLNWSNAQIETINTGNIFTWPTIAPSSIDFYNGAIPGWKNSLLVSSLKFGMFRLKLNSTGTMIDSTASTNAVDTFPLLHSWRVRDIAINPSATSGVFWVIIDSSGSTSGPTGGFNGSNSNTKDGGKLLKLTYKTLLSLPISYTSFTGKLQTDKTVRLNWTAETDQDHRYFEVQRSADNRSFVTIGNVTSGAPYVFIDPSPMAGHNYYRIKQIDANATGKLSKVIDILYDPNMFIVSVYPNPIKDQMTLRYSSPVKQKIHIEVTDVSGRLMFQQWKTVDTGADEVRINVSDWSSQMYVLKISGENNNVLMTQKIVKQ